MVSTTNQKVYKLSTSDHVRNYEHGHIELDTTLKLWTQPSQNNAMGTTLKLWTQPSQNNAIREKAQSLRNKISQIQMKHGCHTRLSKDTTTISKLRTQPEQSKSSLHIHFLFLLYVCLFMVCNDYRVLDTGSVTPRL